MDIDMTTNGAQCALVGAQSRINHRQIGLSAAHQEVNCCVLTVAERLDLGCGSGAVFVLAVAHGLHHVGCSQGFQHLGMAAFGIVVVEINHMFLSWKNELHPF